MILLLIATSLFITDQPAATTNAPSPSPSPADDLIRLQPKPEMIDIVPTLTVLSLQRAAEFYIKKLGFSLVIQTPTYIAVGRDQVQIGMIADRNAPKGFKQSNYVRMARVEEYYKELQQRGVKMTQELKLQPSLMKEFSVTDPDGNTTIFGEYTGN